MTTVYAPQPDEGYELCHPADPGDFETFNVAVNGEQRAEGWQPIRVRLISSEGGKRLAAADSPWLGDHALILRPRAVAVLGAILLRCGELLPLRCEDAEGLVVLNPRCLPALDEARSTIRRFRSGRAMVVERYEFLGHALVGAAAFKIPTLRVSPTFVSQVVVDAWDRAGLRGLKFRPVWSDE